MRREDFDHVIAAAANALNVDAFVVIGSQAILGPHPDAPANLVRSMEVDIYPAASPERAIEIDGSLGDGSPFHEAFGFYAHGIGPETAAAPRGWQDRLIEIEIRRRPGSDRRPVALCLEPHDLVLAKCVANRERDWEFAEGCVEAGLVSRDTLIDRVQNLAVRPAIRASIGRRLEALSR